jgi:DNA-binding NtrC family response regulator
MPARESSSAARGAKLHGDDATNGLTTEPAKGPSEAGAGPVPRRVLVVEDDHDTRNSFRQLLEMVLKVEVDVAEDGKQALELLSQRPYSVVITDLRMPRLSGMQLLEQIESKRLPVTVIVTTGHGSVADAVKAMRMGAYDFLTKPPDPQNFCVLIERAMRDRSLQDELAALRAQLQERHSFQNVVSKSRRMFEIFELIGHVAETATTVLIVGETGTGKEQVARAIHQASAPVRSGPFVAVNCAALPESLLESELFGHEKGSFTGAAGQRVGRFQQAHGGTLFLDEVGDIPAPMQIKLLRVLQERKFERVGGNATIEVDVRVIAATNRPLEKLVKDGQFREDLYYRLDVVRIDLPPLRDRTEDIPLLAAHFAQKYSRNGNVPARIAPEAMDRLLTFPWPGNIRQLENAIERACLTARDGTIRPENLPPDLCRSAAARTGISVDLSRPLPDQLAELTSRFEERYLRRALKRCRGHIGRVAKVSGLSRRSISNKVSQFNIDSSAYK